MTSDNITIIFKHNDMNTTLIVRSKNGAKLTSNNYNIVPLISMDNTLELLDLERVPFNELVPKYKQIKSEDILLGQSCSICHEDYKIKEFKRELNCKHYFHKKCIDKWLKNNLSCPVCRHLIGSKN